MEIADTGVGIPPEHQSKIFEPGFSTKSDQGVAKTARCASRLCLT